PDAIPGLVAFAQRYGLEVGNDIVIEPLNRLVGADYLMPVVMTYERHAITKELGNLMTIFPGIRSVQVAKDLPHGITAQGLAMTSPESWAKTDLKALQEGQGRLAVGVEGDRRGPITIAAVATINPTNTGTSSGGSAGSTEQPETEKSTHAARLVVF